MMANSLEGILVFRILTAIMKHLPTELVENLTNMNTTIDDFGKEAKEIVKTSTQEMSEGMENHGRQIGPGSKGIGWGYHCEFL